MRRSLHPFLPLLLLAMSKSSLQAQAPTMVSPAPAPSFDLALGYNNIRANAPPADCGCFDMNGGFASANLPVWRWLSAAVEVTGGHANNISALGQNLTLTTYTAGPRITLGTHHIAPFAQALFGAAHGSDSYFPNNGSYSTSATSFALTAGGGIDYNLSRHVALRLVEAQYLHTTFPNGANDSQQHLMLGAGVVFKFGGRHTAKYDQRPSPPPAAPAAADTPPPSQPAAPIVNTPAPEAPQPPPPNPAPAPSQPAPAVNNEAPSSTPTLSEVLFDYNSAELRPDAEPSLAQAKALLSDHPETTMLLAGYTDERGSTGYDLALGKRRARSVQKALLRRGIRANRLKITSYGKSGQVCTSHEESCWQKNRRVTFVPKP